MSFVRKLSVAYLLCASAFSVAIAFEHDPALERASRATLRKAFAFFESSVVRPGVLLARDGGNRLISAYVAYTTPPQKKVAVRTPAKPIPPREVHSTLAKALTARAPDLTLSAMPAAGTPEIQIAAVPPQKSLLPTLKRDHLGPVELSRVQLRLRENLTREMLDHFGLFLYVSKANKGPWAQRLYVFQKDSRKQLALLYDWPASTGRERHEVAPNGTRQNTITPRGYYELDPNRMFRAHFSGQWHEPMPYAMFFNWEDHGYRTGLAIHAATGEELEQLGTRASAGCIRIAPENAELLFGLIRAQYKGLTPRFAYDARTATMSNDGEFMRDGAGRLRLAEGYKVLVFIENYGGENVVAALF